METTLLLSPIFCARNILAALTNLRHDPNVVRQNLSKLSKTESTRFRLQAIMLKA
jgi:hypothetical protein